MNMALISNGEKLYPGKRKR